MDNSYYYERKHATGEYFTNLKEAIFEAILHNIVVSFDGPVHGQGHWVWMKMNWADQGLVIFNKLVAREEMILAIEEVMIEHQFIVTDEEDTYPDRDIEEKYDD